MNSIAKRITALCLNQRLKCIKLVTKRTLYHPEVLRIDSYLREKEALQSRLGNHKEKFLTRLKAQVQNEGQIYTDDFKTLFLLVDNRELTDFAFQVYDIFRDQQHKSAFPTNIKYGCIVLQMLYVNNQVQTAFDWFYDNKKAMVRSVCRNVECFVLMLDMLYKAERYDDISTLASTFDEYFPQSHWMLTVMHLGALYHTLHLSLTKWVDTSKPKWYSSWRLGKDVVIVLGTRDAMYEVQAKLNLHVITETPLPYRCLLFSTMLAYKQKEYETMLEILELPIFENVVNKVNGKGTNLALLAYINLDRVEEAVMSLKSVLVSSTRSSPIIFPCVLEKVKEAVMKCDHIELKATFNEVERALIRGQFLRFRDLDYHLKSFIGQKEMANVKHLMTSKKSYRVFEDNMMYQPHR